MRTTFLNVSITVEGHDEDDAYNKLNNLLTDSDIIVEWRSDTFCTEKNPDVRDTAVLCRPPAHD